MRSLCGFVIRFALLFAFVGVSSASTVVLYDNGLGNLPGDQAGLIYFGVGIASQTVVPNGTNLITDHLAQAGYTPAPSVVPPLGPLGGFSIDFQLQVQQELHNSDDRAGFSVILLGSDVRGVELAFWENEIWAQSDAPLFTHGEGTTYDTTTGITEYSLQIVGSQYELLANGTSILTGTTKDYTAFTGPIDPYETPNFVFFGDDTTSAAADVILGQIELNSCLCPEPANSGAFVLGLICVVIYRRQVHLANGRSTS